MHMALYLVTGGAGFIGSHLVDALLAAGHEVRVVDNLSTGRRENLDPRCELVLGDVSVPRVAHRAMRGVEGCFHLAAIASVERSVTDWAGTHRANQGGTVAVLDAARAAGRVPVVYASSAAVYGDQGKDPLSEDAEPRPRTAYGADKLGSELHAAVAFGVHGVPTMGMRFFNVYGPRQDPASPYSGVISIFASRIAARLPVTINGDGLQARDFVYVGDIVAHLMAAMQTLERTPQVKVLNVCTGRPTSILGLSRVLGALTGQPRRLRFGPARMGDIRVSLGDPTTARATLGIAALTTLEDGLMRLLEWSPCHGAVLEAAPCGPPGPSRADAPMTTLQGLQQCAG
jgi:UDP-glucose 4-epimerase